MTSARWRLGSRSIHVSVHNFEGKPKIHFRRFTFGMHVKKLVSSKKGIALNVDEWTKLKKIIKSIDREIENITKPKAATLSETTVGESSCSGNKGARKIINDILSS